MNRRSAIVLCAVLSLPSLAGADMATQPLREHLHSLGQSAHAAGHRRVGNAILGLEADVERLEGSPTMTVERIGDRTIYTAGDTTFHVAPNQITVERDGEHATLTVAKVQGTFASWDSSFKSAGRSKSVGIVSSTVNGRNAVKINRTP